MSIGIIFSQETSKGDEAVVGDPDFLSYYPIDEPCHSKKWSITGEEITISELLGMEEFINPVLILL